MKIIACLALLFLCAVVFALLHAARTLPEADGDLMDDAEVWRRAFPEHYD